jgi:hypothetical protein
MEEVSSLFHRLAGDWALNISMICRQFEVLLRLSREGRPCRLQTLDVLLVQHYQMLWLTPPNRGQVAYREGTLLMASNSNCPRNGFFK